MIRRRVASGSIIVCVLAAASAAAAASILTTRTLVDDESFKSSDFSLDVVEELSYDEQQVTVALDIAAPRAVVVPDGTGVVTRVDCGVRGQEVTLRSGDVPLTINNSPVLVIQTDVPLWRQPSDGDSGPDVEALQHSLNSLAGISVGVTGTYDAPTADAVAALASRHATGTVATTVAPLLAWLPVSPFAADCLIGVGEPFDRDAFVESPRLVGLTLQSDFSSSSSLDGERTLLLGDQSIAYDNETRSIELSAAELTAIDDEAQVQALLDSATQDGQALTLPATLRLASPQSIVRVPPSSIGGQEGGTCVMSLDGRFVDVEILGSSLGNTILRANPDLVAAERIHGIFPDEDVCAPSD